MSFDALVGRPPLSRVATTPRRWQIELLCKTSGHGGLGGAAGLALVEGLRLAGFGISSPYGLASAEHDAIGWNVGNPTRRLVHAYSFLSQRACSASAYEREKNNACV
jgi:hypothetical protein